MEVRFFTTEEDWNTGLFFELTFSQTFDFKSREFGISGVGYEIKSALSHQPNFTKFCPFI